MTTMSPGGSVGTSRGLTYSRTAAPDGAPSRIMVAVMPSRLRAPAKGVVFQCPCGTTARQRAPRTARPRSLVLCVEALVSSMKTSRTHRYPASSQGLAHARPKSCQGSWQPAPEPHRRAVRAERRSPPCGRASKLPGRVQRSSHCRDGNAIPFRSTAARHAALNRCTQPPAQIVRTRHKRWPPLQPVSSITFQKTRRIPYQFNQIGFCPSAQRHWN